MAQKPREEWSAAYRRRVERAEAKHGAEMARQIARGHRAKEHVTRRERKIAVGETPLSTADYAFLKKQRQRSPATQNRIVGTRPDGTPLFANETPEQRFARTRAAYLRLSRANRDDVRRKQQVMEDRYRRAVARSAAGDDYEDEDFYELVDEMEDDLTPIYFYHTI